MALSSDHPDFPGLRPYTPTAREFFEQTRSVAIILYEKLYEMGPSEQPSIEELESVFTVLRSDISAIVTVLRARENAGLQNGGPSSDESTRNSSRNSLDALSAILSSLLELESRLNTNPQGINPEAGEVRMTDNTDTDRIFTALDEASPFDIHDIAARVLRHNREVPDRDVPNREIMLSGSTSSEMLRLSFDLNEVGWAVNVEGVQISTASPHGTPSGSEPYNLPQTLLSEVFLDSNENPFPNEVLRRERAISELGSFSTTREEERKTCSICLCDFQTGQELRKLPCTHEYHAECIDNWLQRAQTCPVDRRYAFRT